MGILKCCRPHLCVLLLVLAGGTANAADTRLADAVKSQNTARVRALLDRPEPERRAAARTRAERFGWPQAVDGFLRAHGLDPVVAPGVSIARQHAPVATLRPAVPMAAGRRPRGEQGADDAGTARYA